MAKDLVELSVGGQIYEGWVNMSLTRAVQALSSQFSLGVTNPWTPQGKAWAIIPGEECVLKIDGETIVTGYIDTVSSSSAAGSRSITISGRDKTGDLVDCSHTGSTEYNDVTLLDLAKKLCAPFSIEVESQVSVPEKFKVFAIATGESIFEALERASRLRGVFMRSSYLGVLTIEAVGAARATTSLIEGQNIVSSSMELSYSERFSQYQVKAQSTGVDDFTGADDHASVLGSALDAGVSRYRPLVISAEGSATGATAKKRAEWEAANRLARAVSVNVEIQGWRQGDGTLWRDNLIVPFRNDFFGIKQDMLISSISYKQSPNETTASLELTRKDAFVAQPEVPASDDLFGGF